jgi:hypothetical protein
MEPDVLKLLAGQELDLLTDKIVLGRKSDWPTRDWSTDVKSTSALYMPLAKRLGWIFGYVPFGKYHGWCVRDRENNLIAMHRGNAYMAMLRAVLWWHLIGKDAEDGIRSETQGRTVTSTAISANGHGSGKVKRREAVEIACTTAA